jgi:hypothetical protein
MKYIIAILLTVALLCFSIVTGRAEQPTELPSGTYYLSLTVEGSNEGLKNFPVHLTTKTAGKIRMKDSDLDRAETDIVLDAGELGKFVGHTDEYYLEGKMYQAIIVLSTTKFNAGFLGGGAKIETLHLIGSVSNHSARGEGTSFKSHSSPNLEGIREVKEAQFKWTLTNQSQD